MDKQISQKVDVFFRQYKHQIYKRGEILIRADDDPSGVFYLTNGQVKMYLISQKGDEFVLNIFKPISFFPMSWAMNATENIYYFEAMNDVEVWRAPKEKAIDFLKQNPDVLYDLLSRVYRGVDGVLTRVAYLMSGNAYERIIKELLIATKRFGKKSDTGNLVLTLSEKDLGTQSGLTRETVSREMKILKDKGLVSLQKSILTINDIESLEEELNII